MTKKFMKNATFYVVSAIMSVLLIWYILYHLFAGFDKEVVTTPAVLATKANSISLVGYIVRDETVLKASREGGVNYLFNDGDKVASGAVVANHYSGIGLAEVSDKILAIDKRLDILENSGVSDKTTQSDTKLIDDKIYEMIFTMRDRIEDADFEYVLYRKDELLTYLNKRQVITHNVTGYDDQIITLREERDALSGLLVNLEENITAERPGYFYSEVDGYEGIFNTSDINDMSLSKFDTIVNSEPVDLSSTFSIGKVVNSSEWYVLSEVTVDEVKRFGEGSSYDVVFPYNSDTAVKMTLNKIIRQNDSEKAVLVFKTNIMPDGFNYLRKQDIQIVEESHTGYKIPANAVRVVDGVEGVYILNGNTVSFKEITVLVEQDGYFIVKEQPTYFEDEFYYKKLGLYDMVITSGKNLYDGKIIGNSGVEK